MQTRLCYLTAAQARVRMNRYGREARTFFFMTDFEARRCVVEEPARLPEDEIRFAFPSVAHGCTALQTSSKNGKTEIILTTAEGRTEEFTLTEKTNKRTPISMNFNIYTSHK